MDIKEWSKQYPRQYQGISGNVKAKDGTVIIIFVTYIDLQTGEGCIQYETDGKDYLITGKIFDIYNINEVSELIMDHMQNNL